MFQNILNIVKGMILGLFIFATIVVGARTLDMSTSPDHFNNWQAVQDAIGTLIDDGTEVAATAAEINRNLDVSARVVTLTADTSITVEDHEGKTLLLGEVGGNATADMTLPEATGSGNRFYFIVSVANTSGYEVQVATNDIFDGYMAIVDGNLQTAANVTYDYTAATSDTLNMDSNLECGDVGDWVEFTDILTGVYSVKGVCRSDGAAYTTVWAAEQS